MVNKLQSLIAVTLFSISLAGSVFAADIDGKVANIKREGRYITIMSKDGNSITVRISSGRTEIKGVGDRSEIKKGQRIFATYDEGDDRKTASAVTVK